MRLTVAHSCILFSVSVLALTTCGTPAAPAAQRTVVPVAPVARSREAAAPSFDPATFPFGIFEDGNIQYGDTDRFAQMLQDVQAHGMDAVMLTNGDSARDAPLLSVSDARGVQVFIIPTVDLNANWWPRRIAATRANARSAAQPIVERWSGHPSFKGYVVKDEPSLDHADKVTLLTQAFHELDPTRPAMPILIGTDRVGPIFTQSGADVMLIDVYPAGYRNPPCDFTLSGFGYSFDFVRYVRIVGESRPQDRPLWMILQTHSFQTSLREPSVAEVRLQSWLALGEGATGIFWFIYSSQQGWRGLADNPPLLGEIGAQAARIGPLRPLLLGLHKGPDRFTVAGAGDPYGSTLEANKGAGTYVIAANRDCERSQPLTIDSPSLKGVLRDVETGQIHALGEPVTFAPGDGKIFELVTPLADLALTTEVDDTSRLFPGGSLTYRVDYTNIGTATATDVQILSMFPDSLVYVGNSLGLAAQAVAPDQVQLVVGTLAPGERQQLLLTFAISNNARVGSSVYHQGVITTASHEEVMDNNSNRSGESMVNAGEQPPKQPLLASYLPVVVSELGARGPRTAAFSHTRGAQRRR